LESAVIIKTFSINTLGCKVNQYEGQQIRELLERLGLRQVERTRQSDLVVVNTCCVTHTASAKSRQYIRKSQRLNPGTAVVVCGCLPRVQIDELNATINNVHIVKNPSELALRLGQIVAGKIGGKDNGRISGKIGNCEPESHQTCPNIAIVENSRKSKSENELGNPLNLQPLKSFSGHTRAFLKVQDGCDGYCSYCIVPKTRPLVCSKPPEAVLEEARNLVASGHREIVLTGIFLGAYGQKTVRRKSWAGRQNDKLADLLDKMAEIPNLARIRVSSLEPADVTPRLLDTFCKHRNIMPHLHLSLQSGSDSVLKKMCRQYRADEFIRIVELIKSRLDRPAITTDIIVGFPGETDADFKQTLDLARAVGFAKMHVFGFSPRKGTAAASMQGTVDNRVIKERSKMLHHLNTELGRKYREQFVGETAEILIENDNGRGRSERYFMVYLDEKCNQLKRNELVRVTLVENNSGGMLGKA